MNRSRMKLSHVIDPISCKRPHKMVAVNRQNEILYTICHLDGDWHGKTDRIFAEHCRQAIKRPHGYRLIAIEYG